MLRPKPIPMSAALRRLIEGGHAGKLDKALSLLHPADVALVLPELDRAARRVVIDRLLHLRKAGPTLSEIPHARLRAILEDLDDGVVTDVVKRLPPDDAADLIQDLPAERSARILDALGLGAAVELRSLLAHSPETAGGIMTTVFFALRETDTAAEATAALKAHGQDPGLYYLYVVDAAGRLKGVLTLLDLILAPGDRPIREFMRTEIHTVSPTTNQEVAAQMFARYNLIAMPVVDDDGVMRGVVTIDDVVDVITEEATEDIYRMAGLSQDDRVFSTWRDSVRLRLPWLAVNLATAVLASSVVAAFEPALSRLALLAVFMPIVPGMGGNAATQTITVIVRGMALGELTAANARAVVAKELTTASVNGLVTGFIGATVVYLWSDNLALGLVLWGAMLVNNLVAAVAGTAIPLTLRALRFDPAIASSIFVTTFTDIFGFLSFLGLATVFFRYLT